MGPARDSLLSSAATTSHPKRIVVFSHDRIGPQMAGPGIRYLRLAQVLARTFEVLLLAPEGSTPWGDLPFQTFRSGEDPAVREAVRCAEVALVPVPLIPHLPALMEAPIPVVVDGYDPVVAETLNLGQDVGPMMRAQTLAALRGDFFLCASERQRDWWLGVLEAHGRINSYTFSEDPSLRRLIDVVPFGMPEEPPRAARPVIRGVWPGIAPEDRIVLWGGGLWPWLDPLTAIRAIARIRPSRPEVRLIFPGTRHPNPGMAGIPTHVEAARRLAETLGLLDQAVFFGDWIPYPDWPGVLLESDIALSLHQDTVEARLAFRSRVLDYIWAGLPIIATRGDATGDLVQRYQLGIVVDPGDEVGVAEAIRALLEQPKAAWADRFERARRELTWERAARPLVEFCRDPRPAPDRTALGKGLGNPYYMAEIARLRARVEGYERGRVIRMLRWLDRVGRRVRGGGR